MSKKKKKPNFSFRELARVTGADRASIAKWCEGITDKKEALQIIEERKKKDPTELSWFQAKAKEETIKLQRINKIAEKAMEKEWMETKKVYDLVSLIMNQLEQLPGKAASQLGLDQRQTQQVQRMVDDVRLSAAQEIDAAL